MRKFLTSLFLIANLGLGVSVFAQETFPHNGPRDKRPEAVIFTHVNLIPTVTIENAAPKGFWKSLWFWLKFLEIRLRFVALLVITGIVVGY